MSTAVGLIYLLCNVMVVDPSGKQRFDVMQGSLMTVDLERGTVTHGPSWQIMRRSGSVILFTGTSPNGKNGTTSMFGSIDIETYNGSATEAITINGKLFAVNTIISCRRAHEPHSK